MKARWPKAIAILAAGIALAGAPSVLPSFIISLLSLVFISALLAASVNMLAGEVGLLSIGHAGIATAAAYGVAWATLHGHGLVVQLGLAAVLTFAASLVYAVMTMRTRGIVFLMITLALGMVVFGLSLKLSSITGGQNGLTGVTRPPAVADARTFYLLTVLTFGIATTALWVLGRSPFGLTLRGVRDSESRMASLGYSVATVKSVAVVLSGVIAGIAGLLAVWHSQFMSPATATFARSALAVVMVILGGTGTLLGPFVGAGVVIGTEHWLSTYLERWPTLLGLVFILVVIFAPRGVVGELEVIGHRVSGRRPTPLAIPPVAIATSEAVNGSSAGESPLAGGNGSSDRWSKEEFP